jgi:hypothetical protein
MWTMALGWLWGLGQGVRHAFEPDHIAAVSTMVAEQKSPRATMTFAAAWGAGHALVLFVFGGALLLLRAELAEPVADAFELLVAAMLVFLGVRGIRPTRPTDPVKGRGPGRPRPPPTPAGTPTN